MMMEKLKDWRVLATLSIIFLLLLCVAIINWERRYFLESPAWHIILAILFGLSFIGFLIFGTKKNGLKILLSIITCCLAFCGLFFWLYSINRSGYPGDYYPVGFGRVWYDFCIVFSVMFGVSVLALLLNLIRRPSEFISNTKSTKKR